MDITYGVCMIFYRLSSYVGVSYDTSVPAGAQLLESSDVIGMYPPEYSHLAPFGLSYDQETNQLVIDLARVEETFAEAARICEKFTSLSDMSDYEADIEKAKISCFFSIAYCVDVEAGVRVVPLPDGTAGQRCILYVLSPKHGMCLADNVTYNAGDVVRSILLEPSDNIEQVVSTNKLLFVEV